MPARIQLVREDPATPFVRNRAQSERLRVTATGLEDVDSEIFLHQQDWTTGGQHTDFVGVATKTDMDAYPVGEANQEIGPYYRLNQLDVILRDPEDANEIWEEIKVATSRLVEALNNEPVVNESETVTIGDPGSDSLSESASSP
jgi:hypothetical protein